MIKAAFFKFTDAEGKPIFIREDSIMAISSPSQELAQIENFEFESIIHTVDANDWYVTESNSEVIEIITKGPLTLAELLKATVKPEKSSTQQERSMIFEDIPVGGKFWYDNVEYIKLSCEEPGYYIDAEIYDQSKILYGLISPSHCAEANLMVKKWASEETGRSKNDLVHIWI